MKAQTGFIEEDYEFLAVGLFHLREPDEEREEPHEAGAPFVEADGDAVPGVLDPGGKYVAGVVGGRIAREALVVAKLHFEMPVLAPVTEDRAAHEVGHAFQLGD